MPRLGEYYWNKKRHHSEVLLRLVREGRWRRSGGSPKLGMGPKFRVLGAYQPTPHAKVSLEDYLLGVAPAIPRYFIAAYALRLFRANYNTACEELEQMGLLDDWQKSLDYEGPLYFETHKGFKRHRRLPKGILAASAYVLQYAEVEEVSCYTARRIQAVTQDTSK